MGQAEPQTPMEVRQCFSQPNGELRIKDCPLGSPTLARSWSPCHAQSPAEGAREEPGFGSQAPCSSMAMPEG